MFELDTPQTRYCKIHEDYARQLAALKIQVDAPVGEVSENIVLVNPEELEYDYYLARAEAEFKTAKIDGETDKKLRADVFRRYLYKHNLVDENLDTVLKHGTKNVPPEKVSDYLSFKFGSALTNTDCMRKVFGIGEGQMIFSENKELQAGYGSGMAFLGFPEDKRKALLNSGIDIPLLLKDRGRIHETMHCLGTGDERKCDTFALLKLLQKHQNPIVYELFANARVNGMLLAVNKLHQDFEREQGWGSYIMINTLAKVKDIAYDSQQLAALRHMGDRELIDMTLRLTDDGRSAGDKNKHIDFPNAEWAEFGRQISGGKNKDLSAEQLKGCRLFQKIMKFAGCRSEADKNRFISERFVRFGLRRKQPTVAQKQALWKEYDGRTLLQKLREEEPKLSGIDLQRRLAEKIIRDNMEKIGRICSEYSRHGAYCFDEVKQQQFKNEISMAQSCCRHAAFICKGLLHQLVRDRGNNR